MVNAKKDAALNEIASFAKKSEKLKEEGNMHFGKRQMKEALVAYQKALEMTLAGGAATRHSAPGGGCVRLVT